MKILSVSRGGLEIARAHMQRPMSTIGRSPACDVILRAPGVAPVQFVLEWIGVGTFNPSQGSWSIFDVSGAADVSGEGVMLDQGAKDFCGFTFSWLEDSLQQAPEIGGAIRDSLSHPDYHAAASGDGRSARRILELIHVRSDSGALEEVVHVRPKIGRKVRPIDSIPEFRILLPRGTGAQRASALQVLLEEMPGAEVQRRGISIGGKKNIEVASDDLLRVLWRGNEFFLRLVEEIRIPPPVRTPLKDRLLLRLLLLGLFFMILFLGVVPFAFKAPEEVKPEEPPRIATVEVREVPPPKPPAEVTEEPKKMEAVKEESKSPAVVKMPVKAPTEKKATQAAAPRQKPAPSKVEQGGLNSPAEVKDVNTIGILGALKSKGPKGPGIQADRILNQGIITESVSGEKGNVVLKTAPAASLGTGRGGVTKSDGGSSLAKAATTLRGGSGYDPKSVGAIGVAGGKPGFQAGNSLDSGSGGLTSGWDFGKLDTRGFSVEGGLDRETVRRVIAQHRSQIRSCYEKALLTNPHLAGRVSYQWTISAAGPVATVKITKSTTGSPPLESCVQDVIKSMNFPAARNLKSTTVIYPFVFQAKI